MADAGCAEAAGLAFMRTGRVTLHGRDVHVSRSGYTARTAESDAPNEGACRSGTRSRRRAVKPNRAGGPVYTQHAAVPSSNRDLVASTGTHTTPQRTSPIEARLAGRSRSVAARTAASRRARIPARSLQRAPARVRVASSARRPRPRPRGRRPITHARARGASPVVTIPAAVGPKRRAPDRSIG